MVEGNKTKSTLPMDNRRKSQAAPASSPSSEELVSSGPNERNWRGIGIALLVIVVVCSLIVTAVVLLTPGDSGPRVKGERLTLEDILGSNFTPPRYNATWISDSEFLYRNEEGSLMLFDAANGNVSVFVSSQPFRKRNAQMWHLSADRRYLLMASEIQKVYRYSFLAHYWIYDIITENSKPLQISPSPELEKMQLVKWGPVNNSFVFVHNNNIYYKPSAASDDVRILTNTKSDEAVFNGVPDWVYEEEILASNSAVWFSKDGQLLCFASFNDTLVEAQPIEHFGDTNKLSIYPKINTVRYPKAGRINPTVILRVVHLNSSFGGSRRKVAPSIDIKPPLSIRDQEHYFTAVEWATDTELTVIWMNRRQNLSIITVCAPPLWICNESFREDMKQLGWVDWYEPPVFSKDGKHYLIRAAVNDGDAGLFRQIVINSLQDRSTITLTMGKFEVTKICSFDDEEGLVYYIAAPEYRPNERQLYQISVNGMNPNSSVYCLTCHLAPDCMFVEAHFSLLSKYFILECQGPAPPKVYVIQSQTNKIVHILESSDALTRNLQAKALPQIRTFRVPVEGGYDAIVRLFLPPELRDDEITTYPLVINVYGGPGTQKVNEKFEMDWGHYLASNKSYIYGMIDSRGSGFQGEKRKFELYRRLGTVEVEDQIDVITYLRDALSFVDKKRIALWGWSYGGYVAARAIATDPGIFKCGISVAPVTNWMLYDSVYTERYMGLPQSNDNYHGYDVADVLKLAKNFKDKKFFLIHGTADDNVHLQQSMLLMSALTQANVIFRSQIYPDENHGLHHVQKHLYLSMNDFLEECFHQEKIEEKLYQEPVDKDDQVDE
ncbi:hypothetical protein CHUAL_003276 [Chamberlinius hualienensis]